MTALYFKPPMKDQFLRVDLNMNQYEEVRLESSVAQLLERLKETDGGTEN